MARFIRLKELSVDTDIFLTPPLKYIQRTDGSLPVEAYRCRVDLNGFLVTGNQFFNGVKIAFMGDSFCESMYCHELDRFVSVVERILNNTGDSFVCLNASYSGSTLLQLFNNFLNKIYPAVGLAGVVVMFPPHSDQEHIYLEGAYWTNTPRGHTVIPPVSEINSNMPQGLFAFSCLLKSIVAVSKELGIRLILATTPYRRQSYTSVVFKCGTQDEYENRQILRRDYNSVVRSLSGIVDVIDADAYLSGNSSLFYDELHLNNCGQNLFGLYLGNILLKKYL